MNDLKQKDPKQDSLRDQIEAIRTITKHICRARQLYSLKINKDYFRDVLESGLPRKDASLHGFNYHKLSLRRKYQETIHENRSYGTQVQMLATKGAK